MDITEKNRLVWWPLALLVICIAVVFLFSADVLNHKTARGNLAALEKNIYRAAVQCYALEGSYPPDLDYLSERYGIMADDGRYFVDYQYVAANLPPDITVLAR